MAAEKEMTRATFLVVLGLVAASAQSVYAYEFEPVAPLDIAAVDKSMLADVYGTWEIRDRAGKRRCRFVLGSEPSIGGYAIEVRPGCAKAFPIMEDISAWRLLEGWGIDLVDPLRKTRVRLYTPDNNYIATGDDKDVAGMDRIIKVPDAKTPAAKKPARK